EIRNKGCPQSLAKSLKNPEVLAMSVSSTAEVKDTATSNGTRSEKSSKTKEQKTMPADTVEAKDSQNTTNGSQALALSVPESPESQSLAPLPGDRPIGTANLAISETFRSAGIRPVESSHLKVTETVNMGGIRPIMSSGLTVVETINFSGIRPVTASTLKISETILNFGERPVASNDIDAGQDLMGFLD
ncbi:hypothetical protein, partial [Planktothrix sp. FACHB-1355]